MSKYFEAPQWQHESLSPDALRVLDEATQNMREWIDKGVTDLSTEMGKRAEEAATRIKQELAQVDEAFVGMQNSLKEMDLRLHKEFLSIFAGNPIGLKQATDALDKAREAAEQDLQERRKKWESIGRKTAETAISLAAKSMGVPLPV
jgi:division protein CdvB (Snf7/Vps24/ESCRT-III family)